jgi:lactoylglutathione lyase
MQIHTGHVGLNVTDVTRSLDFYQLLMELDVLGEGSQERRRFAFLGHDGAPVLTLWPQSTGSFRRRCHGF